MTIEVTENEENTLTITWDKTSPTESILNTWTEEDFIRVIMDACQDVITNNLDDTQPPAL
jgi:hypothetical protein